MLCAQGRSRQGACDGGSLTGSLRHDRSCERGSEAQAKSRPCCGSGGSDGAEALERNGVAFELVL